MSRQEFLNQLEAVLEVSQGSLTGEEQLSALPSWDSMTILSFIAMVDDTLGIQVSATALAQCKTVADLIAVAGDKVTG